MSEVGRPHRLWQAYGDRRETEVKTSKKPKVGLRNLSSCLFNKPLLPTPDFGLPFLTTKGSIKITVELKYIFDYTYESNKLFQISGCYYSTSTTYKLSTR